VWELGCLLRRGFANVITQPNLQILVVSGVLSVNQVEDAFPIFHLNEYNISMEVEWDPNKSNLTLQQHGVNFAAAGNSQQIFATIEVINLH
jgi:hypothetical protein